MISEFVATQQNRLDVEANHAHTHESVDARWSWLRLVVWIRCPGNKRGGMTIKAIQFTMLLILSPVPFGSWHICASSGLGPLDPSNHLIHYKNNPSKTGQKALTKEQNHIHFLCAFQIFWGSKLKGNYCIFTPLRWLSPMSSTGCDTDVASFTVII